MYPTLCIKYRIWSCRGWAPAGEVKEFGVSPPYGEVLLFRQKDPKPLTPRLALLKGRDANLRRADQLAGPVLSFAEGLTQGPLNAKSVPPWGQPAGVGLMVMCWTREGCCENHVAWLGHRSFAAAQDDKRGRDEGERKRWMPESDCRGWWRRRMGFE